MELVDINKLCMGCMKEMEQNEKFCSFCGYGRMQDKEVMYHLKPYTILNGKYIVGKVLGEGGFGITYIGYDINLEMKVAIKEFYPNGFVTREGASTSLITVYTGQNADTIAKWKEGFLREARCLAKCSNSAGIVGVKDFFEENNTAYIIMEYLEGNTLKDYVNKVDGKLPINEVLSLVEPIINSLVEVHKQGLIHRDISPDNIMILSDGKMKLLDFGAARDFTSTGEKSLSVMLKPGYAPEEQYRTKGYQGPWSDVYALCATIYKCITGITPPESMERMRKDDLIPLNKLGISVSNNVEQALYRGMEVYAENRIQSMSELKMLLYGSTETIIPTQTQEISLNDKMNMTRKTTPLSELVEKKKIDIKTILLIVIIVFLVIILCMIIGKKSNMTEEVQTSMTTDNVESAGDPIEAEGEDSTEIIKKTSEEEPIEETVMPSKEEEFPEEATYDLVEEFGIDPYTEEDYSRNLDTSEYLYYSSNKANNFCFAYPAFLYNDVEKSNSVSDGEYGTCSEKIVMYGSMGSTLEFTLFERTENEPVDQAGEYIYERELSKWVSGGKIKNKIENNEGTIIVTGLDEYNRAVYDLTYINMDNIMNMKVRFPNDGSQKEKRDYVVECIYRMCGFGGSTKGPRSYEEYISETQ